LIYVVAGAHCWWMMTRAVPADDNSSAADKKLSFDISTTGPTNACISELLQYSKIEEFQGNPKGFPTYEFHLSPRPVRHTHLHQRMTLFIQGHLPTSFSVMKCLNICRAVQLSVPAGTWWWLYERTPVGGVVQSCEDAYPGPLGRDTPDDFAHSRTWGSICRHWASSRSTADRKSEIRRKCTAFRQSHCTFQVSEVPRILFYVTWWSMLL
jgi:hypothetical protein